MTTNFFFWLFFFREEIIAVTQTLLRSSQQVRSRWVDRSGCMLDHEMWIVLPLLYISYNASYENLLLHASWHWMQHKYHEDESQFNETQRHVINNNNNIYKVGSLKDEKKVDVDSKNFGGGALFFILCHITNHNCNNASYTIKTCNYITPIVGKKLQKSVSKVFYGHFSWHFWLHNFAGITGLKLPFLV